MTVLATVAAVVRSVLELVGFWTAVALPLGYVYLLYNGLTGPELLRLAQLIVLHVLTFVVGRGYNARTASDQPMSRYQDQNRLI